MNPTSRIEPRRTLFSARISTRFPDPSVIRMEPFGVAMRTQSPRLKASSTEKSD